MIGNFCFRDNLDLNFPLFSRFPSVRIEILENFGDLHTELATMVGNSTRCTFHVCEVNMHNLVNRNKFHPFWLGNIRFLNHTVHFKLICLRGKFGFQEKRASVFRMVTKLAFGNDVSFASGSAVWIRSLIRTPTSTACMPFHLFVFMEQEVSLTNDTHHVW